ncbi:hypothetical protein GCM10023116_31320 [Kistimonas scapharcae]|uniref:Outer membrane protein beta-barrel domain-containing protein n=1 Tax=Kistimonas scapharcae TaxID=1036133 RepID=A0ABP8V620_9GAMM
MKKILVLLCLLASPAWAEFYMGVGAGQTSLDVDLSTSSGTLGGFDDDDTTAAYMITLGYRLESPEYYGSAFVAVEADAINHDIALRHQVGNLVEEGEAKNTFSASVIGGTEIYPGIDAYVRLGVARTKFEERFTGPSSSSSSNEKEEGVVWGFGAEFKDLMAGLSLRLDYRSTHYDTFKFYSNGAKVKIESNMLTMSVLYRFK